MYSIAQDMRFCLSVVKSYYRIGATKTAIRYKTTRQFKQSIYSSTRFLENCIRFFPCRIQCILLLQDLMERQKEVIEKIRKDCITRQLFILLMMLINNSKNILKNRIVVLCVLLVFYLPYKLFSTYLMCNLSLSNLHIVIIYVHIYLLDTVRSSVYTIYSTQ